jgi:uncharacterized protein YndB with AHSA1/START domain
MSINQELGIISLSQRYKFPLKEVFQAISQGRLCDAVGGVMNLSSHSFEVGGAFKAYYNSKSFDEGTYLQIQEPNRVCFSWKPSFHDLVSQVEITLEEVNNFTELRLVHTSLLGSDLIHSFHQGWTECLGYFTDELDGTTIRVYNGPQISDHPLC